VIVKIVFVCICFVFLCLVPHPVVILSNFWVHGIYYVKNMLVLEAVNCTAGLSCSDAFESLAWASVQIHCQCTTNSKVVYPDGNLFTAEELSTANTGMHLKR
jgi:hypothetical protein